ncbi:MAG: hypothetical protein H8K07_07715 [Nitrospira sp.]|jgi:hypothetical protein|nr:hypothetical protein [Nitrospira sp.]MDI3463397.1 hypothetical protein [Nitrospira sp.]
MQYLSEDQVNQMMGVGYLGEVRQGPDGNLYQYVQGVDGLGNPIGGFWSRLKRFARGVVRKALPIAQQFAPFIPGGATALTAVTPFLKQAGVAGQEGLGALYQAPDGSLYQQVQGLAEDEELRGLGEDEVTQMMGIGYLGEVRQGPDGNLYQYVQGVDGLGNPIGGFWSRLKRVARGVVRKALPIAQRFAPFIPGGAAALTVATPFLKQAGVAGYQGLDEDDELRGLAEDEELRGLDEDEELRGIDEDEELRGLSEDEELRGLDADDELQGLAEDEDLRGVGEDQDMQGFDGYIRRDGMNGLEAFVPQEPPQTRWHVASAQPPEVWKPLW